MHSLQYLLLIQRDNYLSFSQAITIPKTKLVTRNESWDLFDFLDFGKTCKEKDRLISMVRAKFENFSDYSKMQDVYDVMMVRNKKCNLVSLKLFIVLAELDLVPLMKNFLHCSPEYRCMTKEFHLSQENLTQLKKKSIREYNTFQIKNGAVIYECEVVFFGDLFYLWKSNGEYLLFSQAGLLCVQATSYFEFIYKINIMLSCSKGINYVY